MLNKMYRWSSSWVGTVIIVLVIIFFIAQAFVIPSGSMKNSLLIGDMLFVKKFSYGVPIPHIPWLEIPLLPDFRHDGHLLDGPKPKRGDIVVFRYPLNPKMHFVKRCIGLGGDLIAIKNKHLMMHFHEGNAYMQKHFPKKHLLNISGKFWVLDPFMSKYAGIHHDKSVVDNGLNPEKLFNMMPIQVPKGEFFMMGDNRDHSDDSRFWGFVKYKYIVGKPWFVYFSFKKNKDIRWARVFQTVNTLQKEALADRKEDKHEAGIY